MTDIDFLNLPKSGKIFGTVDCAVDLQRTCPLMTQTGHLRQGHCPCVRLRAISSPRGGAVFVAFAVMRTWNVSADASRNAFQDPF